MSLQTEIKTAESKVKMLKSFSTRWRLLLEHLATNGFTKHGDDESNGSWYIKGLGKTYSLMVFIGFEEPSYAYVINEDTEKIYEESGNFLSDRVGELIQWLKNIKFPQRYKMTINYEREFDYFGDLEEAIDLCYCLTGEDGWDYSDSIMEDVQNSVKVIKVKQ